MKCFCKLLPCLNKRREVAEGSTVCLFASPANFCSDGFLHFKKISKLITNIK